MSKLRVFVSSVQKELEHERQAVAQLISVDPFLLKHCEPVLYDKEPPTGRPNEKDYLDCLRSCEIYLLLDAPVFSEQDGYFVVVFPGPAGNYERLRVPEGATGLITPAVEAHLNERQKKIVVQVQKEGFVTRAWCVSRFKVANDTAGRDLKGLTELSILSSQGKGRAVRYVLRGIATESTDNRPT